MSFQKIHPQDYLRVYAEKQRKPNKALFKTLRVHTAADKHEQRRYQTDARTDK